MLSRLACWVAVVTVAAVVAAPLSAQSSLATGTRVRLILAEKGQRPLIGALMSASADSIMLTNEQGTWRLPREGVRTVDVSAGLRRPVLRYAMVAGGAGFLAGAVIGAVSKPCEPEAFFDCMFEPTSRTASAGFWAVVLGVPALAGGALLGGLRTVEVWRPARLDVRPTLLPERAGKARIALVVHHRL